MTRISFILMVLGALTAACGKVTRVQDSILDLGVSNDLRMVDVRAGVINLAASGNGSYLDYEGTRYMLGNLSNSASNVLAQFPTGQDQPIYFKGSFARRSGVVSSSPSQVYDVVDLDMVNRR